MKRAMLSVLLMLVIVIDAFPQPDSTKQKKDFPVKITGTLGITTYFYNVEGRDASRQPFSWVLTGSPTVSMYGVDMPFQFLVGEQQREFRQPFNKFGLSPQIKGVTLHLGYRNLTFSPYSLGGHTIFGVGAEGSVKKVRFGAVYGRLLRSVAPITDFEEFSTSVINPSFQRMGYSMKLGYGTESNYLDLILFGAIDQQNSIELDSLPSNFRPEENMVLSVVTKQKIGEHFMFSAELATAALTSDITAYSDGVDTMDLPFNPARSLVFENGTTHTGNVIDAAGGYVSDHFSLNMHLKRIDPNFVSNGAYFFQNDVQNITVEPRFTFMEKKLEFGASVGRQKDNLDEEKLLQTNRNIGSATIRFADGPFQADASFSNYDIGQKQGVTTMDSLYRISQTTRNLMFNLAYTLAGEKNVVALIANYNYQQMHDKSENTTYNADFGNHAFVTTFFVTNLKHSLSGGVLFNYTNYSSDQVTMSYMGPSFTLSKMLAKGKLSLNASYSLFNNNQDQQKYSTLNVLSVGSSLRLNKQNRLRFRYSRNNGKYFTTVNPEYTENKGEISYVYTF